MQKQPGGHTSNCRAMKNVKILYGPVATIFDSTKTGTWRVVRPVVEPARCTSCGTCQKYCPTDVIEVYGKERGGGVGFDYDYCKGCGICAEICPKKCIEMVPEKGDGR